MRAPRIGIIARSEDRGLGIQTWEACRHLDPHRVLLVLPPWDPESQHPERYDEFNTTVMEWEPGYKLKEDLVRRWLSGLDVVYTAETFYDMRLPLWADEAHVRVVVHANPEMTHRRMRRRVVQWWAPTPWQIDEMPMETRVVPMPVATDRTVTRTTSDRVRFLHTVGRAADGDRNGTRIVAEAVRYLDTPCEVIVRGIDAMPQVRARNPEVRVDWKLGAVPDYWDLYRNADVLLMPRRYGGLCLPAQEAMAAGIPVVMTDCSPNEIWPGPRISPVLSKPFDCMGGRFESIEGDYAELAEVMADLATNPTRLAELSAEATAWAEAHSWEALTPLWMDHLAGTLSRS